MALVARFATTAADMCLALEPLHVGSPTSLPPHWAVLIVSVVFLVAAIVVGVALADRLLDRLVL